MHGSRLNPTYLLQGHTVHQSFLNNLVCLYSLQQIIALGCRKDRKVFDELYYLVIIVNTVRSFGLCVAFRLQSTSKAMRVLHSTTVLNKKTVRILLGLVIVTLFFFCLPLRLDGNGFLSSTENEEGLEEDSQHYEAALVVASQTKDNTTWLREGFTGWRKEIYVVDDATARLTVPVNKGREAMVYLTYVSSPSQPNIDH